MCLMLLMSMLLMRVVEVKQLMTGGHSFVFSIHSPWCLLSSFYIRIKLGIYTHTKKIGEDCYHFKQHKDPRI